MCKFITFVPADTTYTDYTHTFRLYTTAEMFVIQQ